MAENAIIDSFDLKVRHVHREQGTVKCAMR